MTRAPMGNGMCHTSIFRHYDLYISPSYVVNDHDVHARALRTFVSILKFNLIYIYIFVNHKEVLRVIDASFFSILM
jgi:hypothetical protein